MFAQILSLTTFVSHRFETPNPCRPAPVPDVTEWLVPVSVGQPQFATESSRTQRALEAADEEVTERDPIAVGWRAAAPALAQA